MDLAPKQAAGLALLRELRSGEFETVHTTLGKILVNIVNTPSEPKYRRLRTTNERIAHLLSARGARQLLIGSGFVEEEENVLSLPEAADISMLQLAVDQLKVQEAARLRPYTAPLHVPLERGRMLAKEVILQVGFRSSELVIGISSQRSAHNSRAATCRTFY